MPKPLRCREMLKRLHGVDTRFTISVRRGKGSHRMVVLTTSSGVAHYPFPCHNDGAEIGKNYLRDIIKYFGLPSDIFD
jgi:hypothetical protein